MTLVNVLLPAFRINVSTSDSQLITLAFEDIFSCLQVQDIIWLNNEQQSKNKQRESQPTETRKRPECVVRVKNIDTNLKDLLECRVKNKQLATQMEKIKLDLTHLVNSYDSYKLKYGSLTMAVLDKYRDLSKSGGRQNSHNGTLPNGNDVKDEFKDKFIEDDHGQNIVKLKNQYECQRRQLIEGISALTRQNIRLKDTVMFYQTQIQAAQKLPQPQVE